MSPLIRVDDQTLEGLNQLSVKYDLVQENTQAKPEASRNSSDFVYIPSIGLYVARQRSHHGLTWNDSHRVLAEEGARMLTVPEFVEFLKYTRENDVKTYNDITQVRSLWRAEWLDAYFEKRKGGFNVLTRDKQNSMKLEGALMRDRTPGISIDSWLQDPHESGLPRQDVDSGSLYYWHPRDGSVARFDADGNRAYLVCSRFPLNRYSVLGVRAVKETP